MHEEMEFGLRCELWGGYEAVRLVCNAYWGSLEMGFMDGDV